MFLTGINWRQTKRIHRLWLGGDGGYFVFVLFSGKGIVCVIFIGGGGVERSKHRRIECIFFLSQLFSWLFKTNSGDMKCPTLKLHIMFKNKFKGYNNIKKRIFKIGISFTKLSWNVFQLTCLKSNLKLY